MLETANVGAMREDLNVDVIDWGRALVSCLATWRVEDALRARTATVRSILMGGDGMVDSRRDAERCRGRRSC